MLLTQELLYILIHFMATYVDKNHKVGPMPFGSSNPIHGSPASLVKFIRSGEAKSRVDLVRISGLSRTTISERVDSLISVGLLSEEGVTESTGGRRAAALSVPRDSGVVIAVDFGVTHCRWAIARLSGEILFEEEVLVDISEGASAVLNWLVAKVTSQLKKFQLAIDSIKGIGLGVPGPVEFATGRVISPPIMSGWHDVSVPKILGVPFKNAKIIVDNDVNMMAIGEYVSSWEKETSNLLFVKHSTGIGAGIVVGRRILHGELGAAGDLGHVAVDSDETYSCACGNTNCVEAVAGGLAIAKQLRKLGLDVESARDVAEAALDGDVRVISVLREAGRQLGAVLSTVVNLLNPGAIVISGSIASAGDALFAGVREVVYSRSTSLATRDLKIVPSTLGARAGVMGSLYSVLEVIFSEASISELLEKQSA